VDAVLLREVEEALKPPERKFDSSLTGEAGRKDFALSFSVII
jgi:hypothetical protein